VGSTHPAERTAPRRGAAAAATVADGGRTAPRRVGVSVDITLPLSTRGVTAIEVEINRGGPGLIGVIRSNDDCKRKFEVNVRAARFSLHDESGARRFSR
jgi:hypothetical protein